MNAFSPWCRLLALICVLFAILGFRSHAAAADVSLKDAVAITLKHNPEVRAEKQKVEESKALVQKASGQFDWTIVSEDKWEKKAVAMTTAEKAFLFAGLGPGANVPDTLKWEASLYEIGIRKKLRFGVTITPDLEGTDIWNNLIGGPPANRPDPGVKVCIPLLRGFGSSAADAEELAAESNRRASADLYVYNVSLRVYQTIAAYWDCLAAREDYETAREMKKRADEIAGIIERLIRGGQMRPGVDYQVKGSVAERKMELARARGRLSKARQLLGLRMGLTPEALKHPPLPNGHFPAVVGVARRQIGYLNSKLAHEAFSKRGDLLAARQNTHTQQALLAKAENGLLPRLDLQSRVSFTSLETSNSTDRFLTAYDRDYTGPNFYVKLRLEIPLENNAARGELRRRQALTHEARLDSIRLTDRAASEVSVALAALESSICECEQAGRFAKNYRRAVDEQVRLVKEMQSSITALITIENRYFQGRLDEIEAHRKYAIALAQLHFVTGTLVNVTGARPRFDVEAISRPPFADGKDNDKQTRVPQPCVR